MTVRLTHRPTRDPNDAQPHRTDLETVSEALAYTYNMSDSRGFPVGREIRIADDVKYDENDLSRATARMRTLIGDNGLSVDEAAAQVATEDGHD